MMEVKQAATGEHLPLPQCDAQHLDNCSMSNKIFFFKYLLCLSNTAEMAQVASKNQENFHKTPLPTGLMVTRLGDIP